MSPMRMACFGWSAFALIILPCSDALAADQADIDSAVDRAKDYLLKSRTGTFWKQEAGVADRTVGMTALCTLALLEAGVPRSDHAVAAGAKFVRENIAGLNDPTAQSNYSICLAVILLDRCFTDAGPIIKQLTLRIAAAQNEKRGGWGYECPPLDPKKQAEWLDTLKKNQTKVPPADAPTGLDADFAGYVDNSNTQFAILALWVGRRHGVPVNYPLLLTERRFRRSQADDGAWNYGAGPKGPPFKTPSMTAAGLLALALGFSAAKENTIIVRGTSKIEAGKHGNADGGPIPPEDLDGDPQVQKAKQFIASYIKDTPLRAFPHLHYFLWSMERVCVAYGWDNDLAGVDWFRWGSDVLVKSQAKDGSFIGDMHTGTLANTCFSILFLKKCDLVPDARALLKKQVVKSGNVADLKKTKPGETGEPATASSEKPPADRKEPTPEELREQTAKDDAAKLLDALVKGAGTRQETALTKLRDTPGKPYTLAMVDAVKKLSGALQQQVRDALAERLKRQKPVSLKFYLASDERELKMAAAWAAALQPCREVIPDIIPLLADPDDGVSAKALDALKVLSDGEDFGKSGERWKQWWAKANK